MLLGSSTDEVTGAVKNTLASTDEFTQKQLGSYQPRLVAINKYYHNIWWYFYHFTLFIRRYYADNRVKNQHRLSVMRQPMTLKMG